MTEKKTERTNPRHWAGHLQRLPDPNQCDLFLFGALGDRQRALPSPRPPFRAVLVGAPCFHLIFSTNFLLFSYWNNWVMFMHFKNVWENMIVNLKNCTQLKKCFLIQTKCSPIQKKFTSFAINVHIFSKVFMNSTIVHQFVKKIHYLKTL